MKRRNHLPESFAELKGKRARGYMRESTVEQGSNSGPEAQREGIERFAAQYGMTLDSGPERAAFEAIKATGGFDGSVYLDLVSGSGFKHRPQFDRMMRDAAAGRFDVLVVYDSTRFGRNMDKVGAWTDQLHEAGVAIAYHYDNLLSSDPSTGSLVSRAVGAAMSEDYRRRLAQKVTEGYRIKRFARGRWSGTAPLGYRMGYEQVWNATKQAHDAVETGVLVVDERERLSATGEVYTNAEVARLIGRLYATGRWGTRPLAAHLNTLGYRTVSGAPFTGGSLRHIIENAAYNGWTTRHARKDKQRRYREEPTEPIRTHEALWDDKLWRAVQRVRKANHRAAGGQMRNLYAFRRLVACYRCGRLMYGESHAHKGAAPLLGYGCITARERHDCPQGFIAEALMVAQVGAWLDGVSAGDLDDWEAIEALLSGEAPTPRRAVDTDAIERKLERLRYLFMDGSLSPEEFQTQKRELTAGLDDDAPVVGVSAETLRRAAARLTNLATIWDAATPEERADLVSAMFARVPVEGRSIVWEGVELADDSLLPVIAANVSAATVAPPDGVGEPTVMFTCKGLGAFIDRLAA